MYATVVPVYKTPGIFLNPDMWNATAQEVRAKCPDATRLNRKLKTFKSSIDAQLYDCDDVITVDVLRSIIKGTYGQTGKETSFILYAQKYNESRYQQGKIGYSTYYNATLSLQHFKRYFMENNILEPKVSGLTIGMVDGFKEWNLTSAKMKSKEAINKKLTPIIKAARYASDNGLLDPKTATAISLRQRGMLQTTAFSIRRLLQLFPCRILMSNSVNTRARQMKGKSVILMKAR